MNNEKREALGWRSTFEVYFGRKSSKLLKYIFPVLKQKEPKYQPVLKPSKKLIADKVQKVKTRKVEKNRNKDIPDINHFLRRNKCSQYSVNKKVLLRIGGKRKNGKVPRKYHITLGNIKKIGKRGDSYKVKFHDPDSQSTKLNWFSVEDLADLEKPNEHEIKRSKYHSKLLEPITREDRYQNFMDQGFALDFDPPGDGNCQFEAISGQLASLGIHRTPQMVRNEIIGYLTEHSTDQDGWPLHLWMHDESFCGYLSRISRDKEYGDHLTLRAAADLYNVNITVVSTLGPKGIVIISPRHFNTYGRIYLGHFAEGEGEHYVSLSLQEELNEPINENFEEIVDFGIARCEFNEETESQFRTLSFFVVFLLFLWQNLLKW